MFKEPSAGGDAPAVRVVLADDAVLLREGLARVLGELGFEVCGQAGDAGALMDLVRLHRPDVAVVDIRMPPSYTNEGLEAAKAILAEEQGTGVLVLSQYIDAVNAVRLAQLPGAGLGYLQKDRVDDLTELTEALRRVAKGQLVIDAELVGRLIARRRQPDPLRVLTKQQRAVLGLVGEGHGDSGIAGRLGISAEDAGAEVAAVFAELGLPAAADERERALAVLGYLRSTADRPDVPPPAEERPVTATGDYRAIEADLDAMAIIRDGLPSAPDYKRVIVVGAGIAGLVAAYELVRAGYDVVVLEARSRPGGRIYTLRHPFAPGLHAEAGAMRIPKSHYLTMAYVERFGLPLRPFTMGSANGYYHFYGSRCRGGEALADLDRLGFDVTTAEHGKPPAQLLQETLAPLVARLDEGGDRAWADLIAEYDRYTTRQFLEEHGWSPGVIEMFALLENQESRLNASFVELFLSEVGQQFVDMCQIEGGMDRLPLAFLPSIGNRIRYGARMVAVDQGSESVSVHYETRGGRQTVTGDRAIVTIPFSVLRHVDVLTPFSHGKQQAIRQLHYDASAKVFLQCRRRFWEEDEGIFGGSSITDLAIRNLYYPEHGRETGRGVLVASYTWARDAERWGSLGSEERIREAIGDVARIHPQITEEVEAGASMVWHEDEFAGGAFALFEPNQKTRLHEHIVAPEGRIHFAGEHASLVHRWIQGSIESGLRAAVEVHRAEALKESVSGAISTIS